MLRISVMHFSYLKLMNRNVWFCVLLVSDSLHLVSLVFPFYMNMHMTHKDVASSWNNLKQC